MSRPTATLLTYLVPISVILSACSPSHVSLITPLISTEQEREEEGEVGDGLGSNCLSICWMTPVERTWYVERGLRVREVGWVRCIAVQGDGDVMEYRLHEGICDIGV